MKFTMAIDSSNLLSNASTMNALVAFIVSRRHLDLTDAIRLHSFFHPNHFDDQLRLVHN